MFHFHEYNSVSHQIWFKTTSNLSNGYNYARGCISELRGTRSDICTHLRRCYTRNSKNSQRVIICKCTKSYTGEGDQLFCFSLFTKKTFNIFQTFKKLHAGFFLWNSEGHICYLVCTWLELFIDNLGSEVCIGFVSICIECVKNQKLRQKLLLSMDVFPVEHERSFTPWLINAFAFFSKSTIKDK